ncbi:hypothetical protein PR003_g5929 [Phytophthora rubi]|uniref:Uncharacterized protein n=1 Tax=Phytophthora rubi TaxID=129364 RepID=A0A6A4FS43_9STRA|nr:hypothetical protein PR002_g7002 [Phytophthora rubi]KAE9349341.1 hypothetical protein PR003_g5929 [Phytophthora rubi]
MDVETARSVQLEDEDYRDEGSDEEYEEKEEVDDDVKSTAELLNKSR